MAVTLLEPVNDDYLAHLTRGVLGQPVVAENLVLMQEFGGREKRVFLRHSMWVHLTQQPERTLGTNAEYGLKRLPLALIHGAGVEMDVQGEAVAELISGVLSEPGGGMKIGVMLRAIDQLYRYLHMRWTQHAPVPVGSELEDYLQHFQEILEMQCARRCVSGEGENDPSLARQVEWLQRLCQVGGVVFGETQERTLEIYRLKLMDLRVWKTLDVANLSLEVEWFFPILQWVFSHARTFVSHNVTAEQGGVSPVVNLTKL